MSSYPVMVLFKVPKSRIVIRFAIDALFIILFLYAGITKLIDFNNFQSKLSQEPYISSFAGIISLALPVWEIATALWLAFSNDTRPGVVSAFILMLFFTVFVALVLGVADHVPCTCGGLLERMTWTQHLIFNIVMLTLSIIDFLMILPPAYVKTTNDVLDELHA